MKQSSFVAAVRAQVASRREAERCLIPVGRGTVLRLPLIYPSPYRVGMFLIDSPWPFLAMYCVVQFVTVPFIVYVAGRGVAGHPVFRRL